MPPKYIHTTLVERHISAPEMAPTKGAGTNAMSESDVKHTQDGGREGGRGRVNEGVRWRKKTGGREKMLKGQEGTR
eukprot:107224-Rhodomonas_salina.1